MFYSVLLVIKREGMKELVEYLRQKEYLNAPASTRWHGNYEGGLVDHCNNVKNYFIDQQVKLLKMEKRISYESVMIVSYLHDICKLGLYKKTPVGYGWNTEVGIRGHAKLSLERIKRFIKLTDLEEKMIKFHMGMYGTYEWAEAHNKDGGEYSIAELTEAFNDPIVKLFYFADDTVSQFIDIKK